MIIITTDIVTPVFQMLVQVILATPHGSNLFVFYLELLINLFILDKINYERL